ncbi:MAG: hypothetical protein JXJ04_04800 [Spirochaetales bacterium]|nr:hypothetical protein [Spirochaetales bacterium]
MTDREKTAEDIRFLRKVLQNAAIKLQAYRKIFLIWGLIILLNGTGSQLLVNFSRIELIPFLWLTTIAAGFILSFLIGREIRKKQQINPSLMKYMVMLWLGGTAVISMFFGINFLSPVFSLAYLPAFTFPVIALCTLVTAALLQSTLGYIFAGLFFTAAIPAALFPNYSLILEALLMGGGLLVLGLVRHG